jgi:hypothetical protein
MRNVMPTLLAHDPSLVIELPRDQRELFVQVRVPGNEATHPHGYDHRDGGAGGPLDAHPQGPSGINALYEKYKISCPTLTPQLVKEMYRDFRRLRGVSSSDLPNDQTLRKARSANPMSDRVTALASSLKTAHPEMSHDECVQRVLDKNKALAAAYDKERK